MCWERESERDTFCILFCIFTELITKRTIYDTSTITNTCLYWLIVSFNGCRRALVQEAPWYINSHLFCYWLQMHQELWACPKSVCFRQIIKQGLRSDAIILFAPRRLYRKLVSSLIAATLDNIACLISCGAICRK